MAMFEIRGTDAVGVLARVEGIISYSLAREMAARRLESQFYPGQLLPFPEEDRSNSSGEALMLNPYGVFKALVAESDYYDPEAEAEEGEECPRCDKENVVPADWCGDCDNCESCCTCDLFYCEGCNCFEESQCDSCERCVVVGGCCDCVSCAACSTNMRPDDVCPDCNKCSESCCDCERCHSCGDTVDSTCADGYGSDCCCDEGCRHVTEAGEPWEKVEG